MDFFHYNMFNDYFFGGEEAKPQFEKFLIEYNGDQCCLLTDPPFGCRTEPLAYTLQSISQRYRTLNHSHRILPIFWIFPYYMEQYVNSVMPELEMVDYKVNYTNHDTYHADEKGRKHGSPVRMFTNVPLDRIVLPSQEGYRWCAKCRRYVSNTNVHCSICQKCPSKSGDTYVHCSLCGLCVKSYYKHCNDCCRCTQRNDHKCAEYQRNLQCNICLRRGHIEINCTRWFEMCHKKRTEIMKITRKALKIKRHICLVCFRANHNEKMCSKRKQLLDECTFLGETTNVLSSTC